MKSIVIVSSYHHHNTLKVAQAMAKALGAELVSPGEVKPETLSGYDLVGLGSGVYSATHHPQLLKLADALPPREDGKAFLFSTDGTPRFAVRNEESLRGKVLSDHSALRSKLEAKGYTIVGNFNCAGFNTNSFLKYFGGLNKGRPNAGDLTRAAAFAKELLATAK